MTAKRFAIVAAGAFALIAPAAAQTTFSNAFLRGNYAFSERSHKATNFHETINGILEADGDGKVKGRAILRVAGRAAVPTTVTGTYTIAGDGTGFLNVVHTATGGDAGSGPFTETFRLAMGKADAHLARIDNGVFNTGELEALQPVASPGYNAETVAGDYMMTETGSFGFGQQFNWLGRVTLDKFGKARGALVYHAPGSQNLLLQVTGDFVIGTDGVGVLTLAYNDPQSFAIDSKGPQQVWSRYWFVAGNGTRFNMVRIDNGAQSTVSFERP